MPEEAVREWLFSAISVPACRQTGQAKILIIKIRGCIPAVKIFAFLDLAKKFSFPDSLLRNGDEITPINKHHLFRRF